MKMNISFELDGSERDNAILQAITAAVVNTPPEGFVSVAAGQRAEPPTEVSVYATEGKATEATNSLNMASGATAKVEDPVDEPPTKPDASANGQRLRELMLEAAKLPEHDIRSVKQVALAAAGISDAKQLPTCSRAGEAISALENLIKTSS